MSMRECTAVLFFLKKSGSEGVSSSFMQFRQHISCTGHRHRGDSKRQTMQARIDNEKSYSAGEDHPGPAADSEVCASEFAACL